MSASVGAEAPAWPTGCEVARLGLEPVPVFPLAGPGIICPVIPMLLEATTLGIPGRGFHQGGDRPG